MSNSLIGKEVDDNDYYYEICFPEFFQAYVKKQRLHHQDCRQLGVWSGCLFCSPENELSDGSPDGKIIREKLMNLSKTDKIPGSCLIQIWRAVEIDGKRFFITQNQPFIISTKEENATISEQLCTYRMKISEDGVIQNVGAVDRVFKNQKMEFTPNIKYYSSKEYFQHDFALSCGIKGSVVIPLFGFPAVIELVSIQQMDEHFWHRDLPKFVAYLQESSLIAPGCKGLCGQEHDTCSSLCDAVCEIKDVLKVFDKSQEVLLAQTWILCKKCNSLSTIERVDHKFVTSHNCNTKIFGTQSLCTYQNGKGVVASAMWFNNLVFCENVADFSIIEYPLSHFARHCDLSACFAICLHSSHTGDLGYVLELFLSPSYLKHGGGIATLVPLLAQMRQNFKTFKVASGEKIGENLSIHVIDAKFLDKLEFFDIGKLDSIEHSVNEKDYIDKGKDVSITELTDVSSTPLKQHRIGEKGLIDLQWKKNVELDLGGSTSEEPIIDSLQTTRRKGRIPISLEDMEKQYGKTLKAAADELSVSVSTLKRIRSEHKISRWPSTKRKSYVIIKAKYGDNKFLEFDHIESSGYHELHKQVVMRLKKEVRVYYQINHNEMILIACDDDLQRHISSSKSSGDTILELTVQYID